MLLRMLAQEFQTLENIFLGFFAEAFQRRDFPFAARLFQSGNVFDLQFVVENLGTLGSETLDADQVHQPRRQRLLQLFIIRKFSGGDERGYFFGDRFANAFDRRQLLIRDERLKILIEPRERARRIVIGARLKRVFPFEFEQGADLFENVGDFGFIQVAITLVRDGAHGRRRYVAGVFGHDARRIARLRRFPFLKTLLEFGGRILSVSVRLATSIVMESPF